MKITMTKHDVSNGRIWDPDHNPLGWALRRAGIYHYGIVGSVLMVPDGHDRAISVPLPKRVANWIARAMKRKEVRPMTFELALRAPRLRRA
jgi:hypothetical protein